MGLWDFVKDAGKSVFGSEAEAAEPAKSAEQLDTDRKVAALNAELNRLGLNDGNVHLTLRGDTVRIDAKGADRDKMEKLILAIGNIKGIAKVEADLPPRPVPAGAAAAAEPPAGLKPTGTAPQAQPAQAPTAQAQPQSAHAQAGQPAPQPAAQAAPQIAPQTGAQDVQPVFHTVKKGDTLSAIAKHYYGNANKYPRIFEANTPMLKDPDDIYPGQVLRIPQD